ncbi:MAG TPA: hypothetical protein VGD64_15160 [Acidisarcina sp.]
MQDFVNLLMLICAAVAALGVGVVMAYLVCKMGFAALKAQTRPAPAVVAAKVQTVRAL